MTETIAIETLLKGLLAQTTITRPTSFTPNMSGRTIYGERLDFTDFKIQPGDFERVLESIQQQRLLIYPKESMMGWVEGYYLYDINMLTKEAVMVMAFSDKNIPPSHTLESLFPLCRNQRNLELLSFLKGWQPIKQKYTDYDY